MKKLNMVVMGIVLLGGLVSQSFADEMSDEDVNIVYQCDFSHPARIHLMLNTINNVVKYYDKKLIPYEIDVVALGPCLQYFMKDFEGTGYAKKPYINHGGPTGAGTSGRLASLNVTGQGNINFYACGNTMKKKNVKAEQLVDYVKITPAGIIKVIDLQREGYAYIKIK